MAGIDVGKCATATPVEFPAKACQVTIDQTRRIIFVPKGEGGLNATTILTSAAWTALLAIDPGDPDYIAVSPYLTRPLITAGEANLTEDQNNLRSMPQFNGFGPGLFVFEFENMDPAAALQYKKITIGTASQAGVSEWDAYFFGRNNRITAMADGSGIPVHNVIIGDTSSTGMNGKNIRAAQLMLEEGWSDLVKTFDANFDTETVIP